MGVVLLLVILAFTLFMANFARRFVRFNRELNEDGHRAFPKIIADPNLYLGYGELAVKIVRILGITFSIIIGALLIMIILAFFKVI
jgi:hypothetical protein